MNFLCAIFVNPNLRRATATLKLTAASEFYSGIAAAQQQEKLKNQEPNEDYDVRQ